MRIAIFGLPYSGKTTIFECLTDMPASSAQPATVFVKGRPNLATVKVPDHRVDVLAEIYRPKKTTYAEIVFQDIVRAPEQMTATILDTAIGAQLRNADVLTLVLRAFPSPMVSAPCDPLREWTQLEDEWVLADLAVVEKRLDRLRREKNRGLESQTLEKCRIHLEAGGALRTLVLTPDESETIKGFCFLSRKKLLVVVNTAEDDPHTLDPNLCTAVKERGGFVMPLCGALEREIAQLPPAEQADFLADLGVAHSSRDRFIRHAFESLDLISFLTSGSDECRAWPILRGTQARKAAAAIHSDLERGFIRAEVVSFEDFIRFGGNEKKVKAAGRYRLEGKQYRVVDGDIIAFRFNV
jgi:hypothetical protein